jgi:hypothetical protein
VNNFHKRREIIREKLGHGLTQAQLEERRHQNVLSRRRIEMGRRYSTIKKSEKIVLDHIETKHFGELQGSFKQSGDLGDLWYSLPVVRYLGGGRIYLTVDGLQTRRIDGSKSGFSHELISMAKPLLEAQSYISECKIYDETCKLNLNLDLFRTIRRPEQSLCHKILASFSIPLNETEKPWITCQPKKIAQVVFARSFRYRNTQTKYLELVRKHKDAVFIGLKEEYEDFISHYGKILYYPIKDFLEMAEVINGSELFIGNQSSPMALAIAMHKPFIQEVSPIIPDCKFNRENAKYMNSMLYL